MFSNFSQMTVYSCTFQAYIKQASINLKFPCELFIEWKTPSGKKSVKSFNKVKPRHGVALFNQALSIQAQLILDEYSQMFLKKQSYLLVNLISPSKPQQPKMVGRITIDLSQVINSQQLCQMQNVRLNYCSTQAHVVFSVRLVGKNVIDLDPRDIDRDSMSDYFSFHTEEKNKNTPKNTPDPKRNFEKSPKSILQDNQTPKSNYILHDLGVYQSSDFKGQKSKQSQIINDIDDSYRYTFQRKDQQFVRKSEINNKNNSIQTPNHNILKLESKIQSEKLKNKLIEQISPTNKELDSKKLKRQYNYQMMALQSQVDKANSSMKQMEIQINRLKIELQRANSLNERYKLQKENTQKVAKAKYQVEIELLNIRKEYFQQKSKRQFAEKEFQKLKNNSQDLKYKQTIKIEENKRINLQKELQNIKSAFNIQLKDEKHKNELKINQIRELVNQNNQLNQQIMNIQRNYKVQIVKRNQAQQQAKQASSEVLRLLIQIQTLQKYKQQVELKQNTNQHNELTIFKLNQQILQLKREISQFNDEIASLRDQMIEKNIKISTLKNTVEQSKSESQQKIKSLINQLEATKNLLLSQVNQAVQNRNVAQKQLYQMKQIKILYENCLKQLKTQSQKNIRLSRLLEGQKQIQLVSQTPPIIINRQNPFNINMQQQLRKEVQKRQGLEQQIQILQKQIFQLKLDAIKQNKEQNKSNSSFNNHQTSKIQSQKQKIKYSATSFELQMKQSNYGFTFEQVQHLKKQNQKLQSDLAFKNQQLQRCNGLISQYQSSYNAMELAKQIDLLKNSLIYKNQQCQGYIDMITNLEMQNQENTQQITAFRQYFENIQNKQVSQKLKQSLKLSRSLAKVKAQNNQSEITNLNILINELNEKLKIKDEQYENCVIQIQTLKNNNQQVKANLNISNDKQYHLQLQQKVSVLTGINEQLEKIILRAQQQISEGKNKVQQLKQQINYLNNELKFSQEQKNQLNTKLLQYNESKILQEFVKQQNQQSNSLKQKNVQLQDILKGNINQISNLRAQITNLNTQKHQLSEELSHLILLNQEIRTKHHTQSQNYILKIQKLEKIINVKDKTIEDLTKDYQILQQELQTINIQTVTLKNQNQQINNKIGAIFNQNQDLQQKINKLENLMLQKQKEYLTEKEIQSKNIKKLQEQKAQLSKYVQQSSQNKQDKKYLTEEIAALNTRLQEQFYKVQDLEDKLIKFSEREAKTKANVYILEEQSNKIFNLLQEKQQNQEIMKQSLIDRQSIIQQKEKQIKQKNEKIKQKDQQIKQYQLLQRELLKKIETINRKLTEISLQKQSFEQYIKQLESQNKIYRSQIKKKQFDLKIAQNTIQSYAKNIAKSINLQEGHDKNLQNIMSFEQMDKKYQNERIRRQQFLQQIFKLKQQVLLNKINTNEQQLKKSGNIKIKLQNQIQQLKYELQNSKEIIAQQKTKLNQKITEALQLEQNNRNIIKQIQRLEEDLFLVNSVSNEREALIDQLKTQNEKFKELLQSFKSQILYYEDLIKSYDDKMSSQLSYQNEGVYQPSNSIKRDEEGSYKQTYPHTIKYQNDQNQKNVLEQRLTKMAQQLMKAEEKIKQLSQPGITNIKDQNQLINLKVQLQEYQNKQVQQMNNILDLKILLKQKEQNNNAMMKQLNMLKRPNSNKILSSGLHEQIEKVYQKLYQILEKRSKRQQIESVIQILIGEKALMQQRYRSHKNQNIIILKARTISMEYQKLKSYFIKMKLPREDKTQILNMIRPSQIAVNEIVQLSESIAEYFYNQQL